MKWNNGMPMDAKLFPIVDVISVITGVAVEQSRANKVDELVHHVTGLPCMPSKASENREVVVDAVRAQLPRSLAEFGMVQLVEFIFEIKTSHDEGSVRPELILMLEKRYGCNMPLCPQHQFSNTSEGLFLLHSIAADCERGMLLCSHEDSIDLR